VWIAYVVGQELKVLPLPAKVAGDRIAKEWDTIKPPEGFDPKYAKYVK
jgi:hypothetical protein